MLPLLAAAGCGLFWDDPYVAVTVTPLNWIEIHYYNATREPIRRVNVRIIGSGRVEVKSGTGYSLSSLTKCLNKYRPYLSTPYVLHSADYKEEDGITYLPLYMTPLL